MPLTFRQPHTHLFRVTISVEGVTTPYLDLGMPAWLPGYNAILDLARNVQKFAAYDGNDGQLVFSKLDKQTWRVWKGRDGRMKITYRVFANNLINANIASHLDETHAFFNGAAVFLYVVGALDTPVVLEILKKDEWKIATGLEKTASDGVFRADNYHVLIDCPTEIGTFAGFDFFVEGIPHHIAVYGLGNFDASFIEGDIVKIVKTCRKLFHGLPYRDYTFIYHLTDRERRSGVEHANSTAIIFNRQDFLARRKYDEFLDVTAHEYFHLWNIKRIRPSGWGPFDYTKETYTLSHWFTEGITSYYAGLILVRAGLWTPEKFYQDMASKVADYENSPGKKVMSLEQASWDIWLKPDNATHTRISYYTKGAVVGFLLDLEIRKKTENRKSLDNVLRYLDTNYGGKNRAYLNEDLLRAINEVSGSDFTGFYDRYIKGTEDIAPDDALSFVGLRLATNRNPAIPWVGVDIQKTLDNLATIRDVVPGSTGYDSGLDVDDIILAAGDERVTYENWPDLLSRQKIGDRVVITLYHRDRLVTKPVLIGSLEKTSYEIQEIVPATREHTQRRASLFEDNSANVSIESANMTIHPK